MKYRVRYYQDGDYEVIDDEDGSSLFVGSLADCESWIRLHEQGYM